MNTDPFRDFDPAPYQAIANMPLQTVVSLAKALDAAMPEDVPAHVEQVADYLRDAATAAEAAMVVRLRESNESSTSADKLLDHAVDPLWSLLRRRLDDWDAYTRQGLDFLADDPDAPVDVDIEELRAKAARARRISEHLFADGGLGFLNRPYAEQVQLMANVLSLIETDDLADDILELTGPELLPMLQHCQVHYEAMVHARSTRLGGSSANLRAQWMRVRQLIIRYAGAVITMLDEDEPETLGMVEAALLPMLTIRPVATRSSEEQDEGEGEGEGEGELESVDEPQPEPQPEHELGDTE